MKLLDKRTIDQRINNFFFASKELMGDSFTSLIEEVKIDTSLRPSENSLYSLIELFNHLNVTLDNVIKQKVDLITMKNQLLSEDVFPYKYVDKLPYSSRFTGFYMLDYIEREFGKKSASLTRQHLQLKPSHFRDLSQKNNLLLGIDIADYVLEHHGHEHVESMGKNSMGHYSKGPHGQELSRMTSISSMLEKLIVEFAPISIEKNYLWKIEKSQVGKLLISGSPKEELIEIFGKDTLKTRSLEILRSGFISTLPSLLPDYLGTCTQLRSLSLGDKIDLYELNYSKVV